MNTAFSTRRASLRSSGAYGIFRRFVWAVPPAVVLFAMLAVYKANGLYPFGGNTVSWCDMDQQVVPLLLTFKDVLSGKEGFFFNLNHAAGMNFFGVFFFFLSSPFTFLVAFVDKADMLSFANVLVLLKMCAIAGTSSYYLYTRNENAPLLNVALSVLTAVSGYVMMYYQNVIWLDMVCVFPLLMLGLDKLKEGKRLLFTVVLSACLFINYYLSYMIVVFLLLYAAIWVILSKNMRFAGDFVICCLVAALVSAIVWLPSFVQYFSSGRRGSVVQALKSSAIITSYDTALPTIFSVLFLYPLALLGVKKQSKRSIHLAMLLVLTTVPIVVEPINKMWQTGDYMSFPTRYAFITVFVCVVAAFEALGSKDVKFADNVRFRRDSGKIPLREALARALSLAVLAASVIYLIFVRAYTKENVGVMDEYATTLWGNEESFAALVSVYICAVAIGLACCLLFKLRLARPIALCLAVCVMVASEFFISPQVYMVAPSHGDEYFRQIVDLSDRIESDGFFRVKTDEEYAWRDFDANMMGGIGYNALGHYTSLTSDAYMTAIKQMGYTSYWMEVGNSGGTELTDAVLSVSHEITGRASGGDVYRNEYYGISEKDFYLPLGIITAEDVIASAATGSSAYKDRANHQATLAREILGDGDIVKIFGLQDGTARGLTVSEANGWYTLEPLAASGDIRFDVDGDARYSLYFNVFYQSNNSIRQPINGKFTVNSPRGSAYSFPSQKKNGVVRLGEYRADTYVSVRVDERVTVSELSVFAIDLEALERAVAATSSIGLRECRGGLSGEYEAKGGECVFLSVPYDEGMRLRINGKRAELHEVYGGFTAFRLDEGVNKIEISYVSPGFVGGACLAAVGVAVLAAAAVIERRRGRRLEPAERINSLCGYAVLLAGAAVIAVVYLLPVVLCFM